MSLPEKKIKKIKLPGDVEGSETYEIIPDKLGDGSTSYVLTPPTLGSDDTIVTTNTTQTITGTKTFDNWLRGKLMSTYQWRFGSQDYNFTIVRYNGNNATSKFSWTGSAHLPENNQDLGGANYKWKDFYMSGTAQMGTKIYFTTNTSYIAEDSSNRIGIWYSGTEKLKIGGSNSIIATHWSPDANDTYNLGNASLSWKNLQMTGVIKNGNVTYGLSLPIMTSWTDNKTIATTDDIPTNYVTTDTAQTISGNKTFSGAVSFSLGGSSDIFTANNSNNQSLTLTLDNGGGYGSGIFYDDQNGDHFNLYFPHASGTLLVNTDKGDDPTADAGYITPKRVRRFQQSFGISPDLLHNINGHDLSGIYKTVTTTVGGYPAVKIVNRSDDSNIDYNNALNYMRKMVGSEYAPQYGDGTVPQYSYIIGGDGTVYKPQWDSTNGLVLFIVNKLALASDLPQIIDMRS